MFQGFSYIISLIIKYIKQMRTILFRGKTVNGNDWVESMTIANGTIKRKAHDIFMEISENKWVGIKKETLSQFTGLTDKNGKRIFEGDILDFGVLTKRTTVVTFEKGCFMHSTNVLYIGCDAMEVVGNIHDNPELLQ